MILCVAGILLVMTGFLIGSLITSLANEQGIVVEPDPRPLVPVVRVLSSAPAEPHLSVVPAGMYFVASNRGKKYYPVDSPAAARLKSENRVYFPDAAAAKRAGFLP